MKALNFRLQTGVELAAGGDAIARAPDGRVVFVSGAAPDELVDVEIDEENRTFMRGHVTRVATAGAARVEAPCAYFGTCGGCTLQHIAIAEQTRSKLAAVIETVARIGKVERGSYEVLPPWSGPAEAYRARARFAVDGVRKTVGFRAAKSRDVVAIDRCLVLEPALEAALERLREAVHNTKLELPPEEEVEAVSLGDHALIALPKKLAELEVREDGRVRVARDKKADTLELDDEHGRLLYSPHVFAQSNTAGNRALVAEMVSMLRDVGDIPELIELYAGSGNFTRVLAKLAKRVRTFEASAPAANLARAVLPKHIDIKSDPVEKALERLVREKTRADAVVLDPPRSGVSPQVITALAALRPRTVVYVSCDPATFARDIGKLAKEARLALDKLRVFDLYPHTAHVEVIGRLARRDA